MSLIRAIDAQDRQETARILSTMPSEVSMKDAEERCALHYAAETADLEMFQQIFEQDTTMIDCQDKNGYTPLFMAVMSGKTDIAKFLITKGANIGHVDKDGHTVVHFAVVCGQLDTLVTLLAKGADVSIPDHLRAYPLHYATSNEEVSHELSLSILHTLLRGGADVNCRDLDERTPILWSGNNGNLEAMMSLKQAGGDIHATDRDQLSVIHGAASHGYHEVIDYFMECSPRSLVDIRDRAGHTPLFYAVSFGHYEAARKLLGYGANANHQANQLRTASHCAAAKGQLRMLKLLKQYNASFEIQNYRGDLPVHEAVQAGCKDVVEWLLALHPSTVDTANHDGRTCLHIAAATGNIELVVLLCTKKSYVNPLMIFKDTMVTPLDLAKQQEHFVVVEYLTNRHSAVESSTIDDKTKEDTRSNFEERKYQAKIARSLHLQNLNNKPEVTRTASDHFKKDSAVNTSSRRVSSAGIARMGKYTSTTDLPHSPSTKTPTSAAVQSEKETGKQGEDKENEKKEKAREDAEELMRQLIRKEVEAVRKERDTLNGEEAPKPEREMSEVDERQDTPHEEYENLPGISDSSEEDEGHFPSSSKSIMRRSQSGDLQQSPNGKEKPTKKSKNSRLVSGKNKGKKDTRAVRIANEDGKANGNAVMARVPNGENGNDEEPYEDDWEPMKTVPIGHDASKRYIHEKSIFQELTHLKRMQIQYGKVQEKILVRSLIGNFCKMHGLNPSQFKFHTFYAWEKFLYEQLKLIYLEERERLSHARGGTSRSDRFETRLRQARAVPLNDSTISRMTKVYGGSSITSTSKSSAKKLICGQGEKRCTCLGKHLLINSNKS